jgi:hypothetical protein
MDELEKAKAAYRRGLLALNSLLAATNENVKKLEERLHSAQEGHRVEISNLRERLAVLEALRAQQRDDTGSHFIAKTMGKEEALKEIKHDEKTEKQLTVEWWKAGAPILVAVITGVVALITSVVNIVLHLVG